jgi:hypothetical protein
MSHRNRDRQPSCVRPWAADREAVAAAARRNVARRSLTALALGVTLTAGLILSTATGATAQPTLTGLPSGVRAVIAQTPSAPPVPANDEVANAQLLSSLPATVSGTTVGATTVTGEAVSSCGGTTTSSVWYSVHASSSAKQRLAVELVAGGKLDASVEVFRAVRSQLEGEQCETTNEEGKASLTFEAQKNAVYDIRVAAEQSSQLAGFTLNVFVPTPEVAPPGLPLPAGGSSGHVDRIQNVNAAYAVTLHAGVSYLVNMVNRTGHGRCLSGELFSPGTRSFQAGRAVLNIDCGGYTLFTPGPGRGGVYSFEVTPDPGYVGNQRFRVQIAPAASDETAPGIALANYGVAHAYLNGAGVQVLRLYRIDVTSHSNLTLRLRAPSAAKLNLRLLDQDGGAIACECGSSGSQTLQQRLRPGRYYAEVSARGASAAAFALERESRTITRTTVYFVAARARQGRASAPAGRATPIHVHVAPAAAGPITVDIERFTPVFGWQFYRQLRTRLNDGTAAIPFTAPAVGRWRVNARYGGSRVSSPSRVGFSYLLVS